MVLFYMDTLKLFIGAPSFGKTTLLCDCYESLSKSKKCCIIYSPCEKEIEISNEVYQMYPIQLEIPKIITIEYLNSIHAEIILIDEVQNRSKEEINTLIRYADKNNIQVLLFGTMFDVYGHIIPVMQYILESGIPFELIKRKCCKCGCTAFNTLHIDKNNNILLSPSNKDEYEILIVCRKCYNKYMRKLKSEQFII